MEKIQRKQRNFVSNDFSALNIVVILMFLMEVTVE